METDIDRELKTLDSCIQRRRAELELLTHPLPVTGTKSLSPRKARIVSKPEAPVEQIRPKVGTDESGWNDTGTSPQFRDAVWANDRQARSESLERLRNKDRDRAEAWEQLLEDHRKRIQELEMELVNTTTTKSHLLERVRRLNKDKDNAQGVVSQLKDERKKFVDVLLESKRYLEEHNEMLAQFSAMHQSDVQKLEESHVKELYLIKNLKELEKKVSEAESPEKYTMIAPAPPAPGASSSPSARFHKAPPQVLDQPQKRSRVPEEKRSSLGTYAVYALHCCTLIAVVLAAYLLVAKGFRL